MSPISTSVTSEKPIEKAEKPFIFDLTSDTATIPTDEMFDIMKQATRGDDVYQVRNFFFDIFIELKKKKIPHGY